MIAEHTILAPEAPAGEARLVRVSLDGERLAYVQGGSLRVGAAAGGAPRVIAELQGEALDLAWSLEGDRLACLLGQELPERQTAVVYDVETARCTFVADSASALAWIPGGDLAFLSTDDRALLLWDARKDQVRALAPIEHAGWASALPRIAVAPGGRRLAVASGRAWQEIQEVWLVSRKSGRVELLTEIPGSGEHVLPFFANDAKTVGLALVDPRKGESGLCILPDRVLRRSRVAEPVVRPAWSPSGRSIVFAKKGVDGAREDWLLDVASGDARLLGRFDGEPLFLSDDSLLFDGGAAAHAIALDEPV